MKSRDNNIFSEHIGRSLTWIIASFVLAVTLHALITGGGITRRTTIRICRLESAALPSAALADALQKPLTEAAEQPVAIFPIAGIAAGDCDLLLLPAFDWLLSPDEFDGIPIFSLDMIPVQNDEALLISGWDGGAGTMPGLSAAELQFTNYRSMNGFWNQLEMLRENGVHLPADLDSFRFAGGDGHACERVIVAVLSGSAGYGACCGTTLREFERAGLIRPEKLHIVARRRALPEMLIISSRAGATHYRSCLNRARSALATGDPAGADGEFVVSIEEVTPAVLERLQAIGQLIGRYRGQFR